MTLVLSMNPFLDPEGDPPLSTYQTIWESERGAKTCLTNSALPCSSEEHFTQGTATKDNLFVYQNCFQPELTSAPKVI